MATLRPNAFQHTVDDIAGTRPRSAQQPFTRVVDDLAAASRNTAPSPSPAAAGVDPRVAEASRARAAAARAGAAAPPSPSAPLTALSRADRLRNMGYRAGQAVGKQLQRPGVKPAAKLASAGLAVHHGGQAIEGFQNDQTWGDTIAAGHQALRSAAAAGAARGNIPAAVFTGASLAGDAIGAALPQSWQDRIGSGVNNVVAGAGRMIGQDWDALSPGTPAQQLRMNAAAPTAVPAGANAAAPTAAGGAGGIGGGGGTVAGAAGPTPPPGFEGMRMGRIYRDGNSFSGWGDPNAQANTRTLLTGAAQTGNMQGLTPLQQRQAQMLRDGGTMDSHGNIMTRDVREGMARAAAEQAAAQRAIPQQTFGPIDGRMGFTQQEARNLLEQAMTKRSGESRADFATRSEAALKALGLEVNERGDIRGSKTQLETNRVSNETDRRGQDVSAQTTRRGQDFDAQERQFQREATLRQRQTLAQIMEIAQGEPRRAAAIAASMGLSPKEFLDMAENAQQFSTRSAASAEKRIEELMSADEEGNIPDAERARVRGMVSRMAPGFFNMSEADQLRVLPDITASVNLLRGANERRNHGLLQMIGWDGSSPEITMLPENLRGAQLGEVTLAEGAFTPGGVRREDYRLRLPDGQVMFIPRERMDQTMQDFLSRQGVDVGALPR